MQYDFQIERNLFEQILQFIIYYYIFILYVYIAYLQNFVYSLEGCSTAVT